MKKIISLLSIASLLTLSSLTLHSQSDLSQILEASHDNPNSYIVTVNGKPNSKAGVKTRREVINEVSYLLKDKSYHIDHVYDTVLNGFSITLDNPADKKVLKGISGVASVEKDHLYSRPSVTVSQNVTTFMNGHAMASSGTSENWQETQTAESLKTYKDNLSAQLTNYSAESMHARNEDVKAVTGKDSSLGKGIKIGIGDTGLYLNQVEGTEQRTTFLDSSESFFETTKGNVNSSTTKKYKDDERVIAEAFRPLADSDLTSDALTSDSIKADGFKESEFTYINNKIPFAYDFADGDNNVDPTGSTSDSNNHGTHVASLAAANGTAFQGIAPKAQLAILKVFSNRATGASTSAIVSSVEAAVKLNLDVVNYSLGSDLTDYAADDPKGGDISMYNALKKASEKGVIINFAAGNAGKGTYAGDTGYSDWTLDTVEGGILGDNAVQDEYTNVIASSSPDRAFYKSILLVGDEKKAVSFSDQSVNRPNMDERDKLDKEHPLTSILPEGETTHEFTFWRIGGTGSSSDYANAAEKLTGKRANVNMQGKIAVVDRGKTTFAEKLDAAENAHADALIVINNVPGATFNMNMDFSNRKPTIPVVFVFQSTRDYFGAENTAGTLTLGSNSVQDAPDGNVYSSFTSNGSTPTLDIAPTISAPGTLIMGAVQADYKGTEASGTTSWESKLLGYENMSGTSMATPNLTGALALTLGEKKNADGVDTTAYEAYRKKVSKMAMSTADYIQDTTQYKEIASPRIQGAGRINVERLLSANSYVTTSLNDKDGEGNQIEDSKAELKNDGTLKTDLSQDKEAYIEIPYTIHNDSSESRTYTPSISLMIPTLRAQVSKETYDAEEAESKKDTAPNLVDNITQSINDDVLEVPESAYQENSTNSITVGANGTATGTMKVRIDNIKVHKTFDITNETDTKKKTFDGTLREYFNNYFNQGKDAAGGSYVEGYLKFHSAASTEDKNVDLSIPYMGFYGDFTKGELVEPFQNETVAGHLYNSDLIDARMKNLSGAYAKSNARSGSTIATHKGAPSGTTISNIGSLDTAAISSSNAEFNIATPDQSNPTDIYAGSEDSSDIIATFFVNRTVKKATYTVEGTDVTGNISMLFPTQTNATTGQALYQAVDQGGVLMKSWLDEQMNIKRGYCDIDTTSLQEGKYTLTFSFEGTSGAKQTKSYNLFIDRTVPTLKGLSVQKNNNGQLSMEVNTDANVVYLNGGSGRTVRDGKVKVIFPKTASEATSASLELRDYAGNSTYALFNPQTFSVIAVSTDFTAADNLFFERVNTKNGESTYVVAVMDKDLNIRVVEAEIQMTVSLGTGLNKDDIAIKVDGTALKDFSYDAASGLATFVLPKGASMISMNYEPVGLGAAPVHVKEEKPDTPVNPETPDTPEKETKKKGCGGSIIATTSAVAAVALLAGGLFLKKKKDEDK